MDSLPGNCPACGTTPGSQHYDNCGHHVGCGCVWRPSIVGVGEPFAGMIADALTDEDVREAKYMESMAWIAVGAALLVCLTVLTVVTLRESLKSG